MSAPYAQIFRDSNDPEDLGRIEVGGVRVSRSRFTPFRTLASHDHEFPCLTVVMRGNVEKTFARATHAVESPDAVAMPQKEAHRARFGRAGAEVLMVEPMSDLMMLLGEGSRLFDRVQPMRDPSVGGLAWRLRGELSSPDPVTPLAVTGLVLELLANAARRNAGRRARPAWVGRAEEYLRAHFAERIELNDVAAAVGQPAGQVVRQFRAHVGDSPCGYVRRLRVDWALRELSTSARSLSEIALDAGFADQSHFTRVFKRQVGV
jgi:AraC family transcriptional regulator